MSGMVQVPMGEFFFGGRQTSEDTIKRYLGLRKLYSNKYEVLFVG